MAMLKTLSKGKIMAGGLAQILPVGGERAASAALREAPTLRVGYGKAQGGLAVGTRQPARFTGRRRRVWRFNESPGDIESGTLDTLPTDYFFGSRIRHSPLSDLMNP